MRFFFERAFSKLNGPDKSEDTSKVTMCSRDCENIAGPWFWIERVEKLSLKLTWNNIEPKWGKMRRHWKIFVIFHASVPFRRFGVRLSLFVDSRQSTAWRFENFVFFALPTRCIFDSINERSYFGVSSRKLPLFPLALCTYCKSYWKSKNL